MAGAGIAGHKGGYGWGPALLRLGNAPTSDENDNRETGSGLLHRGPSVRRFARNDAPVGGILDPEDAAVRHGLKLEPVSVSSYQTDVQWDRLLGLRISCSVIFNRECVLPWGH